jgi:hypothetical protein
MIIETKLNIGDNFWVPRVTEEINQEFIEVDGKQYSHIDRSLVASVKTKKVTMVEININSDKMNIIYWAKGSEEPSEALYDTIYEEEEATQFASEEAALAFAINWVAEKKTTYYGGGGSEYLAPDTTL